MISHCSHPPISALRERMIEDMTVRGFNEKTRHDYVRNVRTFAAFIGRSPDTATAEKVRRFQLHQTATGMQELNSVEHLRSPYVLGAFRCISATSCRAPGRN